MRDEAPHRRKTVTVVFCDLSGSTALGERLDPEALRELLRRYFDDMRGIVERHGGTVEKFIGDAVMAVFGDPTVHEDDALRAVRAAAEMRDAIPALGLQGRIGVMTGEVVTGTAERLATGDAVNVAARLEQAAAPGEVLIGAPTLELAGGAAAVEAVEPLVLKGKSDPVPAYRLLSVGEPAGRSDAAPFVGRERELEWLDRTWRRVKDERRCELVTVVGEPGVGKSRLAGEFVAAVDARVVRGRCLPYGEGITYVPVVEVLRELGVRPPDASAARAVAVLLGEVSDATSPDELAWAFRKTLEQAAAENPLLVLLEDIQWAEETLLDLIEHVGLLSSGAPILLLCLARPELTDSRPAWPVSLRVDVLPPERVRELMAGRAGSELGDRIAHAAGGNPLFVEEMLAVAEASGDQVRVPPTLQALLAARLDGLPPEERRVLERGAVEGELFHRGVVQALEPDDDRVTPRLASLVRKGLIAPHTAQIAGDDGFQFHHLLIRDAAYEALAKSARADLHERLAAWLELRGGDLVERDELVGHHVEQSCLYRAQLGLPDDPQLAERGRQHLAAAGRRALHRSDNAAAARLLGRAAALERQGDPDIRLHTELLDALYWTGDREEALRSSESIAERAAGAGDRVAELTALLQGDIFRLAFQPDGAAEALEARLEDALPLLEACGQDVPLYVARHALAELAFNGGKLDAALEAFDRAAHHAARAGLSQRFVDWRSSCCFYGTMAAPAVLDWLDRQGPEAERDHWLRMYRAGTLTMMGSIEQGRSMMAEIRRELRDRGGGIKLAVTTGIEAAEFELLAGDPDAAARLAEEGCAELERLGDRGFLSTATAVRAHALLAIGRLDEAHACARRSAELGGDGDAFTQFAWRRAAALVLAQRGDHSDAVALAREAVAIADRTDFLNGQADARADLAEVLDLAGLRDQAAAERRTAVSLYERKGNIVSADRLRARPTGSA